MIQVWSSPIRSFHILLILSILTLFLTEDFKKIHEITGLFVLFLIIFRITYGIITKNRYEKISTFFYGLSDIYKFIISILKQKEIRYLGHNPLAGIVMILMFLILIMMTISGVIGFAMKEEEGFFAFLITNNFELGKEILHIHHFLSNLLLALIGFHLIGVAVSSFLTKENLAKSIFITGLKRKNQ